MSEKKTILRIRYADDPTKDWITLEREKPAREREPLTGTQQLYRTTIRWAGIIMVVLFLSLLVSCDGVSIIREIGKI